MLSEERIALNKLRFIELINSIEREGFRKELFLSKLENSDFYYAPASTRYHGSFRGGLVNHILSVYDNLVVLNDVKQTHIDETSLKVAALFHDIAKRNYYETYYKNEKIYSENGTKQDAGGRFDWVQTSAYKVRDVSDRFLFCNHEVTCEFVARQFIPLTLDESVAILHHHGGMGDDSIKESVTPIFDRYPLATLLHLADMLSVYIDESVENQSVN